MTRFERFFYKNITIIRRTVQACSVLFIIAVPLLNRFGIKDVTGTYYSISVGNLDLMDPALMFQYILLNKEAFFALILAGGIPLFITLLFGKVFCGWVCPYNLIAEYADKIRKIVRPKTIRLKNKNPRPHYYWFVFGAIVTFIAISGIPAITFLSFPGLISAQIADYVIFGALGLEILFVVFILLLEIFIAPRFWCKYACPVGATLGLLRARNTLAITYDANVCANNCPVNLKKVTLCNEACPLQLNPRQEGIYPYCINCGECIDACENKGGQAIRFSFHSYKKRKLSR